MQVTELTTKVCARLLFVQPHAQPPGFVLSMSLIFPNGVSVLKMSLKSAGVLNSHSIPFLPGHTHSVAYIFNKLNGTVSVLCL
jgi:hypothetical protein